ncbi:MAG: hypothetical protein ABI233_07280 [Chthoniobacterales bacterium]
MKLRERLQMFVLTKQEQRTIAFIVLVLMLGLITMHYRATHPPTKTAEPSTAVQSR